MKEVLATPVPLAGWLLRFFRIRCKQEENFQVRLRHPVGSSRTKLREAPEVSEEGGKVIASCGSRSGIVSVKDALAAGAAVAGGRGRGVGGWAMPVADGPSARSASMAWVSFPQH